MTRRALVALGVSMLAAAVLPASASGAASGSAPSPGSPVTVDIGPGRDVAAGLAAQRDGKIVVVGTSNLHPQGTGNSDMAVVRFERDGRVDTTFGDGGRVLIDNGDNEGANAVAIQPDGMIVVVGRAAVYGTQMMDQVAVTRLDQAGRPDATFNGGRMFVLQRDLRTSVGNAVALQPDGKILVAGGGAVWDDRLRRLTDMLVTRLTPAGGLDGSFGDAGLVITDPGGYEVSDSAVFVGVRPDGRVVAAGNSSGSSYCGAPGSGTPTCQPSNPHTLVQYSPLGVPDASFGTGGLIHNFMGGLMAGAVLKPDGTLVTTGRALPGASGGGIGVTAYRTDGTLDTRFGVAGATTTFAPPSGSVSYGASFGEAIAMDRRGRLVVAGAAYGLGSVDAAVVRYSGTGALDASLGRAGWVKNDVAGGFDVFHAVGILPDGAIAAAGSAVKDGAEAFLLVVREPPSGPSVTQGSGWNPVGQLGEGTTTDRLAPTTIPGFAGAALMAGGVLHSLALDDTGRVHASGWNGVGLLGDGTTTDRRHPAPVPGLSNVATLAAGYFHSLAVSSGTVKAWGWNPTGQLGDASTVDRHTPVPVRGLDKVTAVAAGAYHSLALRNDGTVWAWGWNGVGQLGDGSNTDRHTPVAVPGLTDIVAVAAGAHHSLALDRTGTVWAWGWNAAGQLGNGSTTDGNRPTRATTDGMVAIAAGGVHNLALRADGSVWGWGWNAVGQVGDGTVVTRPVSLRISGLPATNAIAAGMLHSAAVSVDQRVWAWGWNAGGQLGDGTRTDRHSPTLTGGRPPAATLAAGIHHTFALSP